MKIYKIFTADEWAELHINGKTKGAAIDLADGYIHFSTGETVAETAAKYFANVSGLMILAVESDHCTDLKWEASRGGILFPHLYRDLTMADVLWAKPLPCNADGHDFPAGIL